MTRRYRRKVNAKGRNEDGGQYAPLPYSMLKSPAWRSLSGNTIKVWLEIRRRFHGGNNGKLSLSLNEGASLLGIGKATVFRSLKELQEKGFLEMTERGQWDGHKATLWRVTDVKCDGHRPTRDWEKWKPKKQRFGSLMDPSPRLLGPPQHPETNIGSNSEPVGQF
jgi:hypothetical protein